jgi:diguanylate cyclase (GGDEF)-like protein
MLGVSAISLIGRRMSDVLQDWPDLQEVATLADRSITREIRAPGTAVSYFEVQTVPLIPRRNQSSGVLMLLRDITDRTQAEVALQAANARLQAQLAENLILQERLREEVIRDPVTHLYNRRFLQETLFRELAHAGREGLPLAVVMLDVDHFKRLNDQYGHQAGDMVLQALAELLLNTTRGEDVVCRYGGEEFAVVLPGASLSNAMRRAEEWRADFERLQVPCAALSLSATFSAGVADFPAAGRSGDDLLGAADQALYIAKRAGRNRVVAWNAAEPPGAPARERMGEVAVRTAVGRE